ncbi:MAG: hypothetical protein KGJ86_15695, partial [Chloroflexota bacterium]|nr:hypothetical protein [Chloroflexota bacterium]
LFHERGWTDGLPIVPPTASAVTRMLRGTDLKSDHVIGSVPPGRANLTVEKLAINAVMAGCVPDYLPILLAASAAVLRPEFNLYGVQATTNPATPLLIVNGPIAREIGLNGKGNVLGPGFRANSAIGRALRLVLRNVGGGIPHETDKATQGQPGKAGMCIAENEDESPWPPLHVEQGLAPEVSAVSALAVTGTFNLLDFASETARGVLGTFARTIATPGMQNAQLGGGPIVCLGPEHAARIASEGFSKEDVKRWLYEHARVPLAAYSAETVRAVLRRRRFRWVLSDDPASTVPVADDWHEFTLLVAGGPGSHSVLMPTFMATKPITVPIVDAAGQPLHSVKDVVRA